VPVHRLLQAQAELKADFLAHPDPDRWGTEIVLSLLPWQPVIDGTLVPIRPIDRIATGAAKEIDLIAGSNREEWNFFVVPNGAIGQIPEEALTAVIAANGLPAQATVDAYRAARPGAGPGELFSAIQGDRIFRIPALRLAEAHAASPSATYTYEFAWRSPQFGGRLGACHGIDVPFVFDTLPAGDNPLLGPNPPRKLAAAMHGAWVSFAKTGDPGWPKFDLTRRATMRFDTESEVVDDPLARERLVWEGVR
jgi:para-nitrobenzyl esterase